MSQGFPSIEGLRAYLAWWVVLSHVLAFCGTLSWLPLGLGKLLALGDHAVNVFIIASGFVITHLLLTRQEPYRDYICRRFFRIVPIYVVCMVLAMLTTSFYVEAFVDPPWGWFSELRRAGKLEESRHWWTHLALHATMLHGLVPRDVLPYSASTFLGPAWSLSLEWQFYLVAPLLVAVLSRSPGQFIAGAALLCGLGWAANRWLQAQYPFPSMLLMSISWFMVGIGSRLAVDRIRGHGARAALLFAAMAASVVALKSKEMLVWMVFFGFALFETRDPGADRPGTRLMSAVVHLVAGNRFVGMLGKVSYSTYLVHIPLFSLVVHLWGVSTQAQMVAALLLAMALLPIVSLALYRTVEAPFISLGRRWVEGQRRRRWRIDAQGLPHT